MGLSRLDATDGMLSFNSPRGKDATEIGTTSHHARGSRNR